MDEGADHTGIAADSPDDAPFPRPDEVLRRLDERAEALTAYRRRRGRQVLVATAALLGAVIGGILIGRRLRLWRRPRSRVGRVAQAMQRMFDPASVPGA